MAEKLKTGNSSKKFSSLVIFWLKSLEKQADGVFQLQLKPSGWSLLHLPNVAHDGFSSTSFPTCAAVHRIRISWSPTLICIFTATTQIDMSSSQMVMVCRGWTLNYLADSLIFTVAPKAPNSEQVLFTVSIFSPTTGTAVQLALVFYSCPYDGLITPPMGRALDQCEYDQSKHK